MVVDSSAALAALFGEEDADFFLRAFASPERKLMSAVSHLETSILVEARKGEAGAKAWANFAAMAGLEIIPFDVSQAKLARDAWRRYGKGRHPAGLKFGDCAAYALAMVSNEALLCRGDHFRKTDVAEKTKEVS